MTSDPSNDERTIEHLLSDLQYGTILARLDAARALGELGDARGLDPLIEALGDRDWHVCQAALVALGKLDEVRAVEPIITSLTREDIRRDLGRAFGIARPACAALARLGEPGFRALLRVLHDFEDNEAIGVSAAHALGALRDPRTIDVLIHALTSPVDEVGQEAAVALRDLGERAVSSLVAALQDIESRHRERYAHMALTWIGAPAVPPLLDALRRSSDRNMRAKAASILGSIHDDRAHEPLQRALHNSDMYVRHEAAIALSAWQDAEGLETLLSALGEGDRCWDDGIAYALRQIGDQALEGLIRVLLDQDRPTAARASAAYALGWIENKRAADALLVVLHDADPVVRARAAGALGQLQTERAASQLTDALRDDDAAVRQQAAQALTAIGAPQAFDALVRFVSDPNEDKAVQRSALMSLGLRFRERAIPLLRRASIEDDPALRGTAMVTLNRLGEPGVQVLLETVQGKAPAELLQQVQGNLRATRTLAIGLLGTRREPRAVEPLIALLEDPDPALRRSAANAVSGIGDERAAEPLLAALRDPDPFVRASAARAMASLGDERAIPDLLRLYDESEANPRLGPFGRDQFLAAVLAIKRRQQVRQPGEA